MLPAVDAAAVGEAVAHVALGELEKVSCEHEHGASMDGGWGRSAGWRVGEISRRVGGGGRRSSASAARHGRAGGKHLRSGTSGPTVARVRIDLDLDRQSVAISGNRWSSVAVTVACVRIDLDLDREGRRAAAAGPRRRLEVSSRARGAARADECFLLHVVQEEEPAKGARIERMRTRVSEGATAEGGERGLASERMRARVGEGTDAGEGGEARVGEGTAAEGG